VEEARMVRDMIPIYGKAFAGVKNGESRSKQGRDSDGTGMLNIRS